MSVGNISIQNRFQVLSLNTDGNELKEYSTDFAYLKSK